MWGMSQAPPPERTPTEPDAVLNRRAQIIATEHWGLLAARSTAQSEVLTRITIFLTLVSAGLVVIGLLAQAPAFADAFAIAMLAILGFLCLIGFMTVVRVMNVAEEDMMYVVAMNRLRGAYVELDPKVADYFLGATADDQEGMKQTYSFLRPRSVSVLIGSSSMLLFVVDGFVFGLFAGAAVTVGGGSAAAAITAGIVTGLALVGALVWYSGIGYVTAWRTYIPRRPTAGRRSYWRSAEPDRTHGRRR